MSNLVIENSHSLEVGSLVAALPMYDFQHLQKHNDIFWTALAKRLALAGLGNVPQVLTRSKRSLEELWSDPNLLFAQTCGYPLMTNLKENVQVVATPIYNADGCRGWFHRSAIVVHKNNTAQTLQDLFQKRCAVNDLSSNTGMNMLRSKVAPLANGKSFFESVVVTGSHALSLEFVATGQADLASIDCVTLAHLKTFASGLVDAIKVIDWTEETPGLPFITSGNTSSDTLEILRCALVDILSDDHLVDTRAALLLEGIELLNLHDYKQIQDTEQNAITLHYPLLS